MPVAIPESVAVVEVTDFQPPPPKENGRTKSTVNLQNIFKTSAKGEVKIEEEKKPSAPDKPVADEDLQNAWDEFAETRKQQAAEYQLLKRNYSREGTSITIPLSNAIEEPLLATIKLPLTTFLRERLQNITISVTGLLKEVTGKKVVYTNKEKFDHLAEKNPALKELKERLGLDTDY